MVPAQQRAECRDITLCEHSPRPMCQRANLIEKSLVAPWVGLPPLAHLPDRQPRSATDTCVADQQSEWSGDGGRLDRRWLGVGGWGLGMILPNPQPPISSSRSDEPDRLLVCDHGVVDSAGRAVEALLAGVDQRRYLGGR